MVEADYLVIGAGMAGMGFVDSLLESTDATVVMVDRRHAPGGHWLDAYPFIRLHQPSSWYGVGSTPLDDERIDADGPEAGFYSRASVAELQAYFARVMRDRFLASGRVRFLPLTEYLGDGRVKSLFGEETEVRVRRKTVDATYTHSSSPETSPPPFDVDGAQVIPPSGLARLQQRPAGVVVIGAGKTAMDTCVWLLEQGADPDSIMWIRSRDAWLGNREFLQPGHLAGNTVRGTVHWLEALAAAESIDEVYERAESEGVVLRIDPDVWPTVFRGPTLSPGELTQLRRIKNVVRLGKVLRVERDRIVLERGEVPTSPNHVHVHCATAGLTRNPAIPVFTDDRITIQYVTRTNMPLSSAAIARVESLDISTDEKNRLCPATSLYETPLGYLEMFIAGLAAERSWQGHPELGAWLREVRVNVTRGKHPEAAQWYQRLGAVIGPAAKNFRRLLEVEPGHEHAH